MIYHIASRADWEQARRTGTYSTSTRGQTLEDVGFIHASWGADQLQRVASLFYADCADPLCILAIDETQLSSEVRAETVVDGGETFPHIYGPLSIDAVVDVLDYARGSDGHFPRPAL